jgi:hypothetical protein
LGAAFLMYILSADNSILNEGTKLMSQVAFGKQFSIWERVNGSRT